MGQGALSDVAGSLEVLCRIGIWSAYRYGDESCVQGDAERHELHSHAERGNENHRGVSPVFRTLQGLCITMSAERGDDNRRDRNSVFLLKKYSALAPLSVNQLHQARLNRI
ncbi:hypothetical protein DNF23_04630 [Pseudomonas syringae pv. pisi]